MGKRINVMVSDTLNSRLDEYSHRYGITKSSLVAFAVGQFLDNQERIQKVVFGADNNEGMLKQFFESIGKEIQKESE